MSTVDDRLRYSNMTIDEIFTEEIADYTVVYNGVLYKSENELIMKLNLQQKAFTQLKKEYDTLDEVIMNCPKTGVPYNRVVEEY